MNSLTHRLPRKALATHILVFLLGLIVILGAQALATFILPCHVMYSLINPVRRCDDTIGQGEWDYEPLRDVLSLKKNELKAAGKVSHLSIFFRDLTHGPRFGIGEYDKFQPASLMKLPVLIAFLHQADLDPSILDKTLSFSGSLDVTENVEQADETIKPDTPYSIRELLRRMIVYSDNYSYKLLMREMNAEPKLLAYFTFRDLDVLRMMLTPNADYVSIQSYATLFAVLYNTGYLSREMSQFALDLLSQSTFREGIVAGVPEEVLVAHKFGRRVFGGNEKEDDQLHDCGIVYHPAMAYVLCVMTSGSVYREQKAAIAEISRIVYDSISSRHMDGDDRASTE